VREPFWLGEQKWHQGGARTLLVRRTKMAITTIKLHKETKERIDKLKDGHNESYDDLLKKILYILNNTRENPEKGKLILEQVETRRQLMLKQLADQEEEDKKEKSKKKKAAKKKTKK
jgi:hypothetical protein